MIKLWDKIQWNLSSPMENIIYKHLYDFSQISRQKELPRGISRFDVASWSDKTVLVGTTAPLFQISVLIFILNTITYMWVLKSIMLKDNNLLADLITSETSESQNSLKEELMHIHIKPEFHMWTVVKNIFNVIKYLTKLIANNFVNDLASSKPVIFL